MKTIQKYAQTRFNIQQSVIAMIGKGHESVVKEKTQEEWQQIYYKLKLKNGLSMFEVGSHQILALNEKNALRKLENIENTKV